MSFQGGYGTGEVRYPSDYPIRLEEETISFYSLDQTQYQDER